MYSVYQYRVHVPVCVCIMNCSDKLSYLYNAWSRSAKAWRILRKQNNKL